MLLAVAASHVLGSCDNPRHSLVGNWEIAPDNELARDEIKLSFRKENGSYYPATLSYSLSPAGSLSIEKGRDHIVCCFGEIDQHFVDYRQKTQLYQDKQIAIRRMLARLRPRTLSPNGPFTLPEGCNFTFDTRSWSSVHFSQGRDEGAFIFQSECEGAGAARAEHLLRLVVAVLPPVDGFPTILKGRRHPK